MVYWFWYTDYIDFIIKSLNCFKKTIKTTTKITGMFIGAKLIIFHLLERWALSFRISIPICPIMSTRRYGILYLVFVEVSVTVWGSYICLSMYDLLVDIKDLRVKEFMEPVLLLEETIFLLLLQLPGGTAFLYLVFAKVSVKVWGFYICLSMYELLVDMKH